MLTVAILCFSMALASAAAKPDGVDMAGDVMKSGGCSTGNPDIQKQKFVNCVQSANIELFNVMRELVSPGGKCNSFVSTFPNPLLGVCEVIGTPQEKALIDCLTPGILAHITKIFSGNIGKAIDTLKKCAPNSDVAKMMGRRK